ncbi:MAG: acetate--CoA ligase family protein [Thermodesulfobacteriota bacterium]
MSTLFRPDLTPLLDPRSIAVVGATAVQSGWGYAGRLVENILSGGFDPAKLFPVNPKYDQLDGLPCYQSLADLPEPADLVVVILSGRRVLAVLEECVRHQAKAALIVSAGFAEAGDQGRQEQEAIRQLARQSGLLVCGPNSLGLAVPKNKVMSHAYMNLAMRPGRIGLVSQSGATAFASILSPALDRNLQFSHVVSTGNEADLESIDFIRHFVHDPDTRAVACFLEGLKEARRFRAVAEEALAAGKPIMVVKVGRSDLGARQAVSHTGALTGSDQAYQAVFDQTGVIRLPYPDDLAETTGLFAQSPPLRAPGVFVVSTSGGMCSLLADMCGVHGLELPSLTEEEGRFIKSRDYLLVYGQPINPLDIRGQGATHLQEILIPFAADPRYGVLVVVLGVSAHGPLSTWIAESLLELRALVAKPLVVLWMGQKLDQEGRFSDQAGFRVLEKAGLPIFSSPEKLMRALKEFIGYHQFRERWLVQRAAGDTEPPAGLDPDGARAFLAGKSGALDEMDSRRLLSFYGLPAPREVLAEDAAAAARAAEELGGPVALKVVSPDLPHKTEAGAVRLNLGDAAAVRAAGEELLARVKAGFPQARVRGLLVQEMILGAREMLVGIGQDRQFGPLVAAGLGGVWVEVLGDVSLRLPPLSRLDAREMLGRLKAAKLLGAFRGQGPADLEGVEDVLLRLSQLALDLEDRVAELDINPLLVKENGVFAVDALVRLKA